MLRIPKKLTLEISDFKRLLAPYIQDVYEEDPTKYSDAIQQFQDLRQSTHSIELDMNGRDVTYRYYAQLDPFATHFQLGEDKLPLEFTWKDVFNGEKVAQMSVAYEKACVIFNLAVIMSHLACSQNRLEDAGLKASFNYFQCAAGLFQFIADNFLHSPTKDLSKDCISYLSQLMLAQAQEVFCEKAVMEKKKNATVSKLLCQCHQMYVHLVEMQSTLTDYLPRSITCTIQLKAKYLNNLFNYYHALVCEESGRYGEQVARLQLADACIKDCLKLGKELSSQSDASTFLVVTSNSLSNTLNTSGGTPPPVQASSSSASGMTALLFRTSSSSNSSDVKPGVVLTEMIRGQSVFVEQALQKAQRDNDIIYHDLPCKLEMLPPVEKVNMTKPMKLSELFPTIQQQLGGQDLFHSLIPLSVHEKSSVYSEEKSSLIRLVSQKCEEADESLQAILASFGYPQLLHRLKAIITNNDSCQRLEEGAPKEVHEWGEYLRAEESKMTLVTCQQEIENIRGAVRMSIERCKFLLSAEQREYEAVKLKHGDRFIQQPSHSASLSLQTELSNYQRDFGAGAEGDRQVSDKLNLHKDNLTLLTRRDLLDQHYNQSVALKTSSNTSNNTNVSLLDIPVEDERGKMTAVKTIESILTQLNQVKQKRKSLISEFKEKVQRDDISKTLLNCGAKKEVSILFQQELEKFNGDRQQIEENIRQQTSLVQQLDAGHQQLNKTGLLADIEKISLSRANLTHLLKQTRVDYDNLKLNLTKGQEFYRELNNRVEALAVKIDSFSDKRRAEREKLVSDLQSGGGGDLSVVSDKLSKLSTFAAPHSYSVPVPASAPAAPAHSYQQQQPYYVQAQVPHQVPHYAPPYLPMQPQYHQQQPSQMGGYPITQQPAYNTGYYPPPQQQQQPPIGQYYQQAPPQQPTLQPLQPNLQSLAHVQPLQPFGSQAPSQQQQQQSSHYNNQQSGGNNSLI